MSEFTEALDNLPDMEEEDWNVILNALVEGTEGDYTHEDEERLQEWVNHTMTDMALLHLISKGLLKIKWDGDVEDWMCSLTETGNTEAEKVIVEQFLKSFDGTDNP